MTIQLDLTANDLIGIIDEAKQAATQASEKFLEEKLNGVDRGACGFAWVQIRKYCDKKIDGRTKVGKLFKQIGVRQDYLGFFQIWNPAQIGVQNVDCLCMGAHAASEVFRKYGFAAYAASRLD